MFLLYFLKHSQWSAAPLSGGNESDVLQFIISAAVTFFFYVSGLDELQM
jgi:hypothetical protein